MTFSVVDGIVIDNNRNVLLGRIEGDLGSASAGAILFNIELGVVRGWNGTQWVSLTQGASQTQTWTWGYNFPGSLGDNTTTSRSSPVSVVGEFTDWIEISSGSGNSSVVGLRSNGEARAWGRNASGELGDNTNINKSSPVLVVGGFTNWSRVVTGGGQSAGIRANGQAWCWGTNAFGQLGDNTITNRSSPVSVVGGFTDWASIAAGGNHTLAIRANGQLWGWGYNNLGQLGDNTITNRSSPVSVVGGFTDWTQISAGGFHNAGIRGGQAWCWGRGNLGQLGNNSAGTFSSPVSVVGGFTDWVQVAAGGNHTAAIRANGQAWAWGDNGFGQLGDGTTSYWFSPRSVVGGFTDWVQITTGDRHTAAIRANGQAWAWGRNLYGRLGDGTTTDRSSPVSVVGGFTDWVQVSGGFFMTAAIRTTQL